tara:strand:- start:563 stop:1549 length:987 start_codon:yes stop_codon:yes gene_type:complete
MERKIKIVVRERSDIERAYALKRIIKQKVEIDNRSNSNKKNIFDKGINNSKLISIPNCDEIIIKPYTSKLIFKSLFIFLDNKLEGLRRRITFFKVKKYIGITLMFLRGLKIIPESKIICINRGMDIKPGFPTFEQIISGRYLAYGRIDKLLAEANGIKVEDKIGYYNYHYKKNTIDNSVLLRPTYYSNNTNDKRVSEIIEKIGNHTCNRPKDLNRITLHPDCYEWNKVYEKQIKYNWTIENRNSAISMSEASIIICEISSPFFASLFLNKDIYLISRVINKPMHFKLKKLINKYLLLIPTIDDIKDLTTKNYPEKARLAILELKSKLF